jgi:ParB-like chromosome segregation protein Spo0J
MSNLVEVWSEVPIFEVANYFPMMTDDEYEGLLDDIRQHGQRQEVVLWQGQLVDGRNRLKACLELGIDCNSRELPEDADPVAFVCSLNIHRRSLEVGQRAMIAARCRRLYDDDAKLRQLSAINPGFSRGRNITPTGNGKTRDIVGAANRVSGSSVDAATKILESGDEELIKEVESGKKKLHTAAKVVAKKKQPAKTIDPPATYEVRRDPLEALKKQIQALDDGPADQLYRWMRHQQASAESDGYVIADGPPLAADDVDLLGQLCESDNAIGVVWHWLKNAGDAKSAVVREFCWGVIEDVDAPGAGASC